MAVKNTIRLLSTGLMIALSAACSSGQIAPASTGDAQPAIDAALSASRPKALAEMPPRPPKVTCNKDLLTISADNSTLGSVLRAVRTCTGVRIDMPDASVGGRIYEELGPGPVRQVLESLLSGTELNYVIGMSDTTPEKVDSILLMSRTNGSPDGLGGRANAPSAELASLSPARRLWLQTSKNGRAIAKGSADSRQVDSDTSETDEMGASAEEDAGGNASPMDANIQAKAAEEIPIPPNASIGGAPQEAAAPDPSKGTSDKITDMQQLFEQRRKIQESQSAAAKPQ